MKRLTCLLIALAMTCSLAACGSKTETVKQTASSSAETQTFSVKESETPAEAVSEAEEPADTQASDAACEVIYSSARMEKDYSDDLELTYVAEVENTGSANITFDYSSSLDLVDADGNIVYTITSLSFYPDALAPGDHAYVSVQEYESFAGDGVSFADVATVNLNAYYSSYADEIEKPDVSFENVTVKNNYGIEVAGTVTNNSTETYKDLDVAIPVFDADGNLAAVDWSMMTLASQESKGFNESVYSYPEELVTPDMTAAPVAFVSVYNFDSEDLFPLKASADVSMVDTDAVATEPEEGEEIDPDFSVDGTATIEDVVSLLQQAMIEGFGEDNSQVYLDGNVLVMSIWEDGGAAEATLAQGGDTEMQEDWQVLTDALVSLSDTATSALVEAGLDGYSVMVNLLNDQNTENTLLSVVDGFVVYDVVTGVNQT